MLERRLAEVEKRFLPRFNPTGSYSHAQYDGVRAYIVLAHAEIEHYLEETTREILKNSLAKWNSKRKAGVCIAALLHYDLRQLKPAASLAAQKPDESLDGSIQRLAKAHEKYLTQENHGIKEKNLLAMFLPVGLLESDFDPVWLGTMNSFGVSRGTVAHSSGRRGFVKTPPDPKIIKSTVSDVMDGLRDLQEAIKKAKS